MQAWRLTDQFGIENLKIVELPDPFRVRARLVVRVRACSLNYRDLVVTQGGYGGAVKASS